MNEGEYPYGFMLVRFLILGNYENNATTDIH